MIALRWPRILHLYAGRSFLYAGAHEAWVVILPRRDLMLREEEGGEYVAALTLHFVVRRGRVRFYWRSDAKEIAERNLLRASGGGNFLVDYERNVLGVTVSG